MKKPSLTMEEHSQEDRQINPNKQVPVTIKM